MLQQFWSVGEPLTPESPTTEDDQCEEWFRKTVKRDKTGRFYVELPFREVVCAQKSKVNMPSYGLGSSRSMALNRLYNLERRFVKDPELYVAYRKFMDDYLALGHMKPAPCSGKYFIPHHAVVKRRQNELKIRVVFDASEKSTSGSSLNDCLVTGPKLQTDISCYEVVSINMFLSQIFPRCTGR